MRSIRTSKYGRMEEWAVRGPLTCYNYTGMHKKGSKTVRRHRGLMTDLPAVTRGLTQGSLASQVSVVRSILTPTISLQLG